MLDRTVVGVDKDDKELNVAEKFAVVKMFEILPLEMTPYEMIRLQLRGDRPIQVGKVRGQLVFFQYADDGQTLIRESISPIEVSDYIREKAMDYAFSRKKATSGEA